MLKRLTSIVSRSAAFDGACDVRLDAAALQYLYLASPGHLNALNRPS